MAQYPSYLNPSYQMNNYSQYGYPQMDRMNQFPQFQQNLQPTSMSTPNQMLATLGKYVESIDIVKATDIPMDGNMYYFPKADGSEIYAKHWLQNGKTEILTFKPVLDKEASNLSSEQEKLKIGLSDEVTEVFMSKFDGIVEKIERLEKSLKPNSRKKEVSSDE